MRITSLQLQNYRSMATAEFELHPRLTILLGPNGSGKTNALEAISLLSVPRSFRGSRDKDLIAWQTEYARVAGKIVYPSGIERELVVFLDESKKLQVDGQIQTVSEFLGQFLSVVFAPEDVNLLDGPPSHRRSFLDSHLSLLSQSYLHHLLSYNQVLSRRNKLLARSQWPTHDDLDYWNEQQVAHGVAIVESRLEAIDQINIALPVGLTVEYSSSLVRDDEAIADIFRHKQEALSDREKQIGHTLLGPQRDDWKLTLESDIDLGQYGSRGQQRMGVIGLKQAQLHIITQQKEDTAVLLLDDVLSELDAQNQQQLVTSIGQQQTILTTASLSDIPEELLHQATIYEMTDGQWSRRDFV